MPTKAPREGVRMAMGAGNCNKGLLGRQEAGTFTLSRQETKKPSQNCPHGICTCYRRKNGTR